jgi:hypothetical protein
MQIKHTALTVAAAACITVGVFQMGAASGFESLNSRIYHVAEVDFANYASQSRDAFSTLDKSSLGKRFLEVFPVSTIKSIAVPGDEVASPTGQIVSVLNNARIAAMTHVAPYLAMSPAKITFVDGTVSNSIFSMIMQMSTALGFASTV